MNPRIILLLVTVITAAGVAYACAAVQPVTIACQPGNYLWRALQC